jgi:outer membrane protein assembly factor BamB
MLLSASHEQILAGRTMAITWNAPDAERCWATDAWSGMAATNGGDTFVLSVPGTYQFSMTCEGFASRETRSVTVLVYGQGTSLTIRADTSNVVAGSQARIRWASTGTSCETFGDWSGSKAISGVEDVAIGEGFNLFGLTCTGPNGTSENWVVVRGLVTTVDLVAEPATIAAGDATTLRWFSWDAASCAASGAWSGAKSIADAEKIRLDTAGDHVFSLTCEGPGAPATQSVAVTALLPKVTLRAIPRAVTLGDTYMLDWTVAYGGSCVASGAWSGSRAIDGSRMFTADTLGTAQYTLTCSNPGGSTAVTETVTTSAPPTGLPKATAYQLNPTHTGATTFPATLQFPETYAWRKTFATEVSSAIVADGRVFVASSHESMLGGQLQALALDTGEVLWGPVALGGRWGVSNATYENGRVFVLNTDGLLASFDAATGAAGWTLQLPAEYFCVWDGPPTAWAGLVFAGGCNRLSGVDQESGELVWTQPVIGGGEGAPAVTSRGVYLGSWSQAYAFSPGVGRLIWHVDNNGSSGGGPTVAVGNGAVYARHLDFPNHGYAIHVLDQDTGRVNDVIPGRTIPVVTPSRLFIVDGGDLKALTPSGSQLWEFDKFYDLGTPIVVNDRVIIGELEKVYALDTATGAVHWQADAGASARSFVAAEGYLIVPAGYTMTAWKIVP